MLTDAEAIEFMRKAVAEMPKLREGSVDVWVHPSTIDTINRMLGRTTTPRVAPLRWAGRRAYERLRAMAAERRKARRG